jgi:hypothetical protein
VAVVCSDGTIAAAVGVACAALLQPATVADITAHTTTASRALMRRPRP